MLPLKFDDGTEVQIEIFQETRRELVKKFGAITVDLSPLQGVWTKGLQYYEDQTIRFILDIPDTKKNRQFFVAYKERLKERFKQLELWITAYPIDII